MVQENRHRINRPAIWLTLILAVAAGVRLFNINREGLWLDEFWSMEFSAGRSFQEDKIPLNVILHDPIELTRLKQAGPWWRPWANLKQETNPPLFYQTLRLWRIAFGDTDLAVRTLPLLFSLLSIFLLFGMASEMLGVEIALWSAAMAALAPPMVVYATETRAYSMMVAFTLGAGWALVRIERLGPKWTRIAALAVCMLLGMLAHYYCLGAFLAMAIYTLIVLKGKSRQAALAAMVLAAILFALVWGPFLVQQLRSSVFSRQISHEVPEGLVGRTIVRALLAPLRQWIGIAIPPQWQTILAAFLAALYLLAAIWIVRQRRDLWLWALMLLCPLILIATVDIKQVRGHLDLPRYLVATAPAVFVLLAAAGRNLKPFAHRIIAGIGVIGCIVALPFCTNLWHGEWQAAADFIAKRAAPDDLIVFVAVAQRDITPGWMYMGVRHYLPGKIPPVLLLTSPQGRKAILAQHPAHLFLVADTDQIDPRMLLPEYLPDEWVADGKYVAVWDMHPVKVQ